MSFELKNFAFEERHVGKTIKS